MKVSLTDTILITLEGYAAGVIDTAWAMSVPNPDSFKRLRYLILNDQAETYGKRIARRARVELEEFHKYRVLLSRLKKQGLIKRDGEESNKTWRLTALGLNRLRRVRSDPRNLKLSGEPGLTILSYDIPESQRRERRRLREILKLADFKLAHQSLWYSKKKVGKDFMKILKDLRILDFVHIFEVSKSGSLELISKTK